MKHPVYNNGDIVYTLSRLNSAIFRRFRRFQPAVYNTPGVGRNRPRLRALAPPTLRPVGAARGDGRESPVPPDPLDDRRRPRPYWIRGCFDVV